MSVPALFLQVIWANCFVSSRVGFYHQVPVDVQEQCQYHSLFDCFCNYPNQQLEVRHVTPTTGLFIWWLLVLEGALFCVGHIYLNFYMYVDIYVTICVYMCVYICRSSQNACMQKFTNYQIYIMIFHESLVFLRHIHINFHSSSISSHSHQYCMNVSFCAYPWCHLP